MSSPYKDIAINYLSNPIIMSGFIFLVSCSSLTMALIAQYVFGLEPCILCIYQRWPYGITALLGVIGLASLYKEEWAKYVAGIVFLSAVTYFIGGLIAFYHVGVEQHWWVSVLEGCAVDFETGSVDELIALFDNKPAVRCDEIPWADPIFGISMAGYNVLMSLGLAVICGISSVLIARRANGML